MSRSTTQEKPHIFPDSGCPSPEMVSDFVEGTLKNPAHQQVQSHMDTCENCFDTIALAMEMHATQAAEEPEPTGIRKFRRNSLLGLGGLLAAAALFLVFNPNLFFDVEAAVLQARQDSADALLELDKKGVSLWHYKSAASSFASEVVLSPSKTRGAGKSEVFTKIDKARNSWLQILKKDPKNIDALDFLLTFSLYSGLTAEARVYANDLNAIEKSPKNQSYIHLINFFDNPHPESQSLDEMQNLYQEHSQDTYVTYHFARMLTELGHLRNEEACQVWRHYVSLDNDSDFAKQAHHFLDSCSPSEE